MVVTRECWQGGRNDRPQPAAPPLRSHTGKAQPVDPAHELPLWGWEPLVVAHSLAHLTSVARPRNDLRGTVPAHVARHFEP